MATKKWVIDPAHTEIQFKVKHLMITTVTGSFTRYEANIESEEEDLRNGKVEFTAYLDSISTNNPDRDAHLKSPDFFDAANHPEIKFIKTKVESVDNDGSYELYGDLTVRGITKNIRLDVEFGGIVKDPWGNTKAGFTIHGKISRKEFGLTWNAVTEAGGLMVSDDVRLACEVQLIKQQ